MKDTDAFRFSSDAERLLVALTPTGQLVLVSKDGSLEANFSRVGDPDYLFVELHLTNRSIAEDKEDDPRVTLGMCTFFDAAQLFRLLEGGESGEALYSMFRFRLLIPAGDPTEENAEKGISGDDHAFEFKALSRGVSAYSEAMV